jgi:hypothetical protein
MHMFNRGFNGQAVNLVSGMKVGPVGLQGQAAAAPAAASAPALAPRPLIAAAAPAASPVQPVAASKPGAVPMGPKASCPVCRTFGG